MKKNCIRLRSMLTLAASLIIAALASSTLAHPLGNFTINHFARIEVGADRIKIHYVIDMAEIPAFQELQKIKASRDSEASTGELQAYAEAEGSKLVEGLKLDIDGATIPLRLSASNATTPPGAGGLATLRIECEIESLIDSARATHRLRYEDSNFRDRIGWREIVVAQSSGVNVFNSAAYGNGLTDALKSYPEDSLSAPLDERVAELSYIRGAMPAGATALMTRDGRVAAQTRDRLAELISVPEITPMIALLGLLIAAALGALHALSPGHGKTVVGAYLAGSRGTARHAVFLGLTVTITHTIGVFALGLLTLFASRYFASEKLFPILSLISGGIVLTIGLNLFIRRLRAALGDSEIVHGAAPHAHSHEHTGHDMHSHHHGRFGRDHAHNHSHGSSLTHSHGGTTHTHLPPGADGSRITWRSLLALGISGGLLPCPSALVVLLSAISLHRVGYGLILVIAFSVGLAATLTAVGLLFVYAGRLINRPIKAGRFARLLPAGSAFVIACAGAIICVEAIATAGWNPVSLLTRLFGA